MALVPLLLVAACQAAAPATPTATTVASTPPVAKPTVAASPSPAAAPKPTVATSPAVAAPSPSGVAAPAVGSSRVEVLNAANDAFQRGDLAAASQLYERVVNTPPSGENPQQTAAVNGLAHFRATVALLATGDEDQAKTHVDALQNADATSAFARLASQLWDQYGMVGSVRGACAQVQPQIASQAGPALQVLQGMGVRADAQSLCVVPGGA